METQQFWVEQEAGQWCVRHREALATHGWETVRRFRRQDQAVAFAADRNARAMGLAAPQRRTPTAAEMSALFEATGAERVHRHWVHHKNQHTE